MKTWTLNEAMLSDLAKDFPNVDVLTQCQAAHAWCKANNKRQKTARGMPRFLVSWMSRANDKPKLNLGGFAGYEKEPDKQRRIAQELLDRERAAWEEAQGHTTQEPLRLVAAGEMTHEADEI